MRAWSVCAAVMASALCSSAVAQQLQFSQDTIARSLLEQRLRLPDRNVLDVRAANAAAARLPAAANDVLIDYPALGSLGNAQDMLPASRADFLCASAPAEQFDPARADGFEPAGTEYDAPWLQANGRLRWHAGNPDAVRCHTAPALVMSPPAIDFGIVPFGQAGTTQVSIRNAGDAALSIGTLAQPRAPFSLVSGCDGVTLQAGQSCQVTVKYTPISTDETLDAAVILSNDPLRIRTRLMLVGRASDLIFRDGFD